jgi:3-isopropylmalate/(R)-2-methylmalate dehydratase small subunit
VAAVAATECRRWDCFAFSIDAVRRTRLLNGWDDIALTESYRDRITAFAADDRIRRPWAIPSVRV